MKPAHPYMAGRYSDTRAARLPSRVVQPAHNRHRGHPNNGTDDYLVG